MQPQTCIYNYAKSTANRRINDLPNDPSTQNITNLLIQLCVNVNNKNYNNIRELIKINNVQKNDIYFYTIVFSIAKLESDFVSDIILLLIDQCEKNILTIDDNCDYALCFGGNGLLYRESGSIHLSHKKLQKNMFGTICDIVENIYTNTNFYSRSMIEKYKTLDIVKFALFAKYNDWEALKDYIIHKKINLTDYKGNHLREMLSNKNYYSLINFANGNNVLHNFVNENYFSFVRKALLNIKENNVFDKEKSSEYYQILKEIILRNECEQNSSMCVYKSINWHAIKCAYENRHFEILYDIFNDSSVNFIAAESGFGHANKYDKIKKIASTLVKCKSAFVNKLSNYHKDVKFLF